MSANKANSSGGSGIVVGGKHRKSLRTRIVILVLALLVLAGLVVLGSLWAVHKFSIGSPPKEAGLTQKELNSNLDAAVNKTIDPKQAVSSATSLITGQQIGKFTITPSNLSSIYLDRANGYMSLKQYKNAVADFEQAARLDSMNKLAALQGEVEARYMLGERKDLVPVYQQLIKLEEQSGDPLRGSVIAQYQQNIQALQNGQELSF